jgi:hypothetical protein
VNTQSSAIQSMVLSCLIGRERTIARLRRKFGAQFRQSWSGYGQRFLHNKRLQRMLKRTAGAQQVCHFNVHMPRPDIAPPLKRGISLLRTRNAIDV